MSTSDDYYTLLGVDKSASTEQIRNGFRDKAMINHPDRGGDPAMYNRIQTAYEALSDPHRRAMYDAGKLVQPGSTEKQFAQSFAQSAPSEKTKMSISRQARHRSWQKCE